MMPCRRVAALIALFAFHAEAAGWPELKDVPITGGGENDAALVIGVDEYAYAPAVPGAERNADDWYRYLVKSREMPATNAVLLRGREATRERIRKYASVVASRVKPGGTLWFVFIGHGAPSQDGSEGVLVGHDAQQEADSLYARSVSQAELQELLGAGAQARTVMLLDACFSGRTQNGNELVPGLQPLLPMVAAAEAQKGRLVLVAARGDQFAGPLPGLARPAFSYLALGGLRGWADADGDGQITGRELVRYADGALRVLAKDRSQNPELSGDAEEALAVSGPEDAPDLGAIALHVKKPPPLVVAPAVGAPVPSVVQPAAVIPQGHVRVELLSASAASRWDVYRDDRVICTTPCTEIMDPQRPLLFRTRDELYGGSDKIQLGGLGPQTTPVQVQAHATHWGKRSTGIVFTSFGGMGVIAGAALTAIGCSSGSTGMCTGGLITAPLSAALTAGGIYLILNSGAFAEIIPLGGTQVALTGPTSLAYTF